MSDDLWGWLDTEHRKEVEQRTGSRASLVANHRLEKRFGTYLRRSRTETEKAARYAFIEEAVERMIKEACEEHEAREQPVRNSVEEFVASIKLACKGCGCEDGKCGEGKDCGCTDCGQCGGDKESKTAGGHAEGCDCGFCQNKGKLPGASSDDEEPEEDDGEEKVSSTIENPGVECPECGSKDVGNQAEHHGGHSMRCNTCGARSFFEKSDDKVKTAEKKLPGWNEHQNGAQEAVGGKDGGSYQMPTVETLSSPDGLDHDRGAVKTDRSRVPDDGLKAIDIKSKDHPHDDQDVEHKWDHQYTGPYTDAGDPNTAERPHSVIDSSKPIGDTQAIPTKTWQGEQHSTSPVTNVALSKWHLAEYSWADIQRQENGAEPNPLAFTGDEMAEAYPGGMEQDDVDVMNHAMEKDMYERSQVRMQQLEAENEAMRMQLEQLMQQAGAPPLGQAEPAQPPMPGPQDQGQGQMPPQGPGPTGP